MNNNHLWRDILVLKAKISASLIIVLLNFSFDKKKHGLYFIHATKDVGLSVKS